MNGRGLDLLSDRYPERIIPLLKAGVEAWTTQMRQNVQNVDTNDTPSWKLRIDDISNTSVVNAIRNNAVNGWNTFRPFLRLFQAFRLLEKPNDKNNQADLLRRMSWNYDLNEAENYVEKLALHSIEGLAENHSDDMISILRSYGGASYPRIERAIAKGLTAGDDSIADAAIEWLCSSPAYFKLGDAYDEIYWTPAVNLIRRFAPVCSEGVYEKLESVILNYHARYERQSFDCQLNDTRNNIYHLGNNWGEAQNHLLDALPVNRMSDTAKHRAAGWRRKFGDPSQKKPTSMHGSGGRVTSPIHPDRLHLVSDKDWLSIIESEWPEHDGRRWREHGRGLVGEASLRQFAEAFGNTAEKNPKRFARLALKIPPSSKPEYFTALLRAFEKRSNDKNLSGGDTPTPQELEAIIFHVGDCRDGEYVISLCRLIQEREAAPWTNELISCLLNYIDHPDPQPEQYSVFSGSSDEQESDAVMTSINCARGCVAGAIRQLMYDRPDDINMLMSAAERLIVDPHPAVRIEAMSLCIPIWDRDQEKAVHLLLECCSHSDDQVLQSRWLHYLFNLVRKTHLDQLMPLIERMAQSEIAKVSELGVFWAIARHFDDGCFSEVANNYITGTQAQRLGVLNATMNYCTYKAIDENACAIFKSMFDDNVPGN